MSIVVTQLGGRMHYAVPRILHNAGLLEHFYTDICAVKGWPSLLRLTPKTWWPSRIQRLLMRVPQGVPPAKITAFTAFGLEYARHLRRARNVDARNAAFLWGGREFCRLAIQSGFGSAQAVYTFNSAGLELLREARRCGVRGITEQTITPREIEYHLISEERARFPDWELPADEGMMKEYIERERAEWAEADLVVCGSDYVREHVVVCGGAPERCVVIPYGLDFATFGTKEAYVTHGGPLRVLTVGTICLRKGSPYVLAVAKLMGGSAIFRMVGSLQILPEAERQLRRHVEVIGPVSREEILKHYAWADVFLLPSLCEGSATVTYEALFNGLPVICTPHTGSVARDGQEGFIVPARDPEAIADRLRQLIDEPSLLATMSARARAHSENHTVEKYGNRLVAMIRARLSHKPLAPVAS